MVLDKKDKTLPFLKFRFKLGFLEEPDISIYETRKFAVIIIKMKENRVIMY